MENIKILSSCQCGKWLYAFYEFPEFGNSKKALEWEAWVKSLKAPDCNIPNCKMMPENSDFELVLEKEGKCLQFIKYLDTRARSKQRAEAREAEGNTTKIQKNRIIELQQYKCYFCLKDLSEHPNWFDPGCRGEIANWDHLQPLTKGGSHYPMNMAFTCKECNQEKSDRTENEYWKLREQKGYGELNHEAKKFIKSYIKLKRKI